MIVLPLSRLAGAALVCGLLARSHPAQAQPSAAPPSRPAAAGSAADETKVDPPQFFENVTVSGTLSPVTVKDSPGTVSVIDDEAIKRRLIENTADLVKFEPGVYIEANPTRIGLNGFSIRGVGGNRVMTQVDGVETSEQFDFGPFNVHQFSLDLDTLKSAEIMRSAGSAVYGSDALGGVVSFFTKDPADYLRRRRFIVAGKTTFDSRARDASLNAVVAGGGSRVQASLFGSGLTGHEPRNKGTVRTQDATRTAFNPQDRQGVQALGKMVVSFSSDNLLRAAVEVSDTTVETEAYTSRTVAVPGITSDDTMTRQRFSLDQSIVGRLGLNTLSWSAYYQRSDTDQVIDEVRLAAAPTPAVNRSGTLNYTQDSFGGTLQGRKAFARGSSSGLVTVGASYKHHTFDMLRDRIDINAATGAVVPATNLTLPSKYFPKSDVDETGAYAQAEVRLGRLLLVPGARYDWFSLDADGSDAVFIATLSPAAEDFSAGALSTKVGASYRLSDAVTAHAQFAEGFRAPPYSAINSGFTNLLGGYTSRPNTTLRPETSRNFEGGLRAAVGRAGLGVTAFTNHYDDFINQASLGTNAATGLQEFQYRNLSKVRINGIEFQADARLGAGLRMRASYAAIRGDDVSGDLDVPLDTIAPDQGALGLGYTAGNDRWGGEATVRAARGQRQEVAGDGLFAPEAFGVVDVSSWVALGQVTLRAGVYNLGDSTYYEWSNVRGRSATDPTISRYSSPGVSGLVSLSYGW